MIAGFLACEAGGTMCRSIKVLRRPGEAATAEELHGAALQFVRKISGFHKPSKANQEAFERAIAEISESSDRLLKAIGVSPVRSKNAAAD
jgi:hypothetical protein